MTDDEPLVPKGVLEGIEDILEGRTATQEGLIEASKEVGELQHECDECGENHAQPCGVPHPLPCGVDKACASNQ